MKPSRGYYTIIQYCPDPSRMEAANIGVLLFCHAREFCQVKMSDNHERVERFFGPHTPGVLNVFAAAKLSFGVRIEVESPVWLIGSEHEGQNWLTEFARMRANQILMTPPRPMKVDNPHKELERLYRDLVIDPERNSP